MTISSHSFAKELLLGLLAALVGCVALWLWDRAIPALIASTFTDAGKIILPLIGLALAAIFFSLAALFIRTHWLVYGSAIFAIGAPFLLISATRTVLGFCVAALLLAAYAVYRIRREVNLSLGFSVTKSLQSGLLAYFTAASLVISTFYFVRLDEVHAVATILPPVLFKTALPALTQNSSPLKKIIPAIPELKPDTTIDQALTALIEKEIAPRGIALDSLPPTERAHILTERRQQIDKTYGASLTGNELVHDVFYSIAIERIKDLLGPYRTYIPLVSTAAFFLAFKTLTFPLHFIVIALTALLIKILTATRILTREKEQVEVERIRL